MDQSRPFFLYFRLFNTVDSKYVKWKFLQMIGFEPWTSSIGSDRSTNWATTSLSICGLHSSVVLSAPTILRLQIQIPCTPSTLFQLVLLKLEWEKDEKEAGIGPLKTSLSIVFADDNGQSSHRGVAETFFRLFEEYPQSRIYFGHLGNSMDELRKDPKLSSALQEHAVRVLQVQCT